MQTLCGRDRSNTTLGAYPFKIGKKDEDRLKSIREAALKALTADLEVLGAGRKATKKLVLTKSGTYGDNDPLTLSFLAEVLLTESAGKSKVIDVSNLLENAREVAGERGKTDPNGAFDGFFDHEKNRSRPVANAFVPLLVIRAAQALDQEVELGTYLRYFEGNLHDQLSFSSIPDSRFDPAELIFSLEGALLVSDQKIDVRLFDRILDVLEQAQQTSAHWRPSKPFLRDEKGFVLFPISVEAANSLLRCCQKLNEDERFHGRSERYIALFRRFWNWLSARRVSVPIGDSQQRVSGWHSDHVADPESIQLWDTAQVVDFLLRYRGSLYEHIARTTLRLSRFNVRKVEQAKQSWSEIAKDKQHARKTIRVMKADDKAALREEFEPVSSLGPKLETYRKVEEDFLVPWLSGNPRSYSMLLYGPPGTGKTSVAENLADALGFPLITITVSDFLAGGGGEVEARAKMIFEVLEAQANSVILFDEIDELVLDRSSKRHGQQDTVFKFMTPGMLTKLNNLRRAKRSIFIMATNYAYRIDPAIRRTGRIDENYLLLPPDAKSRQRMITDFLKEAVKEKKVAVGSPLDPDTISRTQWLPLTNASLFLGYKDIEAAIARVIDETSGGLSHKALEKEMLDSGRTTTLRGYSDAFDEIDDREAITRELFPLVEMAKREGTALQERLSREMSALFKEGSDNSPAAFQDKKVLENQASAFIGPTELEGDEK